MCLQGYTCKNKRRNEEEKNAVLKGEMKSPFLVSNFYWSSGFQDKEFYEISKYRTEYTAAYHIQCGSHPSIDGFNKMAATRKNFFFPFIWLGLLDQLENGSSKPFRLFELCHIHLEQLV